MDGELKPILVALIINLIIVYVLPKLFVNPTGFKAFDDFVSYLKAQQAFIGFSSVLLAVVLYASMYYMKNYSGPSEASEELLTEDFLTPSPRQK